MRTQLEDELKKIDSREARIRLAFENEVDTLEEYQSNKKRLNEERIRIQEQIQALDSYDTPDDSPSRSDILEKVHTVYDILKSEEVDYETKAFFIRSVVEDIVYDKENGRMIFTLYIS